MKTNERDPANVVLGWTFTVSMFLLMLCLFSLSPLAYLWMMGLVACTGTLIGTLAILANMGTFGLLFFGGDILKCGFELIGAILSGLASIND